MDIGGDLGRRTKWQWKREEDKRVCQDWGKESLQVKGEGWVSLGKGGPRGGDRQGGVRRT